jgi:hypothetical protein
MNMTQHNMEHLNFFEDCIGLTGGHTNYWRDKRVIEKLVDVGLFETEVSVSNTQCVGKC